MLLEQPDLLCRHYVTPHRDASIQVVPTSLQCEMRNVVMLTLCVSSYSEFDSLIHKTIYKPISTTPIYKPFGSQIPWSLTSRSVDGGTFNSCAAFGKNGISWIPKVHQIHLWKGQSYDNGFMFNVYIFCIPYSVCQQGPSIKRSLRYQTQRSYHSKSMELICEKNLHTTWKQHFAGQSSNFWGTHVRTFQISWCFFLDLHDFLLNSFCFLGNPGPHQTLGGCASLLLPGQILMQQLLTIFPAPICVSYTKWQQNIVGMYLSYSMYSQHVTSSI